MNTPLRPDQPIEFITPDGKPVPGKIISVLNETHARIALPNGEAIAEFSDTGAPGTFHFPASATASAKQEKPTEAKK